MHHPSRDQVMWGSGGGGLGSCILLLQPCLKYGETPDSSKVIYPHEECVGVEIHGVFQNDDLRMVQREQDFHWALCWRLFRRWHGHGSWKFIDNLQTRRRSNYSRILMSAFLFLDLFSFFALHSGAACMTEFDKHFRENRRLLEFPTHP